MFRLYIEYARLWAGDREAQTYNEDGSKELDWEAYS